MSNNHSLPERIFFRLLALLSNVLVAFGFFLLASSIGEFLMGAYLGKKPERIDFSITGENASVMKNTLLVGQIGGTLVGMIALPLLYIFFLKKELREDIFKPSWKNISPFMMVAISITFVIMPLIAIIGDWNNTIQLPSSWNALETAMRAMENMAAQATKLIVAYNSIGEMLLVLFTVALLPAVAEELVFRGILQNELIKTTKNIHVAVFISALIFSFIHLQFFGFFPRLLLGIVLGYLYITSGNILVSMLMHFTNNAVVVLALNLYAKGALKIDPESSKDLPTESIYISIIMSSALLFYCWRMYKLRTHPEKTNV